MSLTAMVHVWEHSPTKGSERLMLLALADSANDDTFTCWPSLKSLAQKVNCSERYAKTLIKKLEAEQHISVLENGGHKTAKGWTNLYTIMIPNRTEWHPREKHVEGGSIDHPLGVKGGSIDHPEPLNTTYTSYTSYLGDQPHEECKQQVQQLKVALVEQFYQTTGVAAYARCQHLAVWLSGRSVPKTKAELADSPDEAKEWDGFSQGAVGIEDVTAFRVWWDRKYSGITKPKERGKFIEHWETFWLQHKQQDANSRLVDLAKRLKLGHRVEQMSLTQLERAIKNQWAINNNRELIAQLAPELAS